MKKHSLTKWLSLAAASALALLAGTAPQAQAAAFDSPVGQWDFTLSGKAAGLAQIVFNGDGTIDGYVQRYTSKKAPEANPRGGPDDGSRTSEPASTNAASITNFIGDAAIEGRWSFDPRGKIVGYLNEGFSLISSSSTNATTNHITFSGVVRLGSSPRVTLQGSGTLGKVTFIGIPDGPLLNMSGNYTATGKRGGVSTVEFFTLTSLGGNHNAYNVTAGSSPAFNFVGDALLSGRKQFSMVTASLGTNGYFLTTLVGSINTNKATASLKGRDSANGRTSLKVFATPP